MKFKKGDIFVILDKGTLLGEAIRFFERINAKDDKARGSHTGIIISEQGDILEAVNHIEKNHLSKYEGVNILIGRNDNMTEFAFAQGMKKVEPHIGQLYPYARLLLFIIPPLAKYIQFGHVVCSELVMKFLYGAGIVSWWRGANPDDVADMVRRCKGWETVFEGQYIRTFQGV